MRLADAQKREKMYKDKFVAALRVDGKILREKDGEVQIPFNSEYSILLKNLESKSVVVNISVDGKDVLDGKKLIIQSYSDLELEGYLNNTTAKNKFKFIEKTKQIEDFRGNRVDDSLIRIEFCFEQDEPITTTTYHNNIHLNDCWIYPRPCRPYIIHTTPFWHDTSGEIECNFYSSRGSSCTPSGGEGNVTLDNFTLGEGDTYTGGMAGNYSDVPNDDGITVKGSEINQQFSHGYTRSLESQSHVMILKIKGFASDKKKVEKPLFVKTKIICSTCGDKNHSGNRFCKNCGTYLE